MTFKFKRSYCSLVELRPHGNRLSLKGRKVPRTMYAGGRLARPYVIGLSIVSHIGKETHIWTQRLTSQSNWNKSTFLATKRLFPCI